MTPLRMRRLCASLTLFVLTISTPASAHGVGAGGSAVAFAVVLGLPTLAGLVGGILTIGYHRRQGFLTSRESRTAVGLLLVVLGVASLLPAAVDHPLVAIAGGIVGAVLSLWIAGGWSGSERCTTHAELTLSAISVHRLLEGVLLGTIYSAGAAVGLLGAVVLTGHTVLETAAVGELYAIHSRRIRAVGAVVLVQAGYVVGIAAGLVVAGVIPVSIRTLVLAVVGGALLVIGADESIDNWSIDGVSTRL